MDYLSAFTIARTSEIIIDISNHNISKSSRNSGIKHQVLGDFTIFYKC